MLFNAWVFVGSSVTNIFFGVDLDGEVIGRGYVCNVAQGLNGTLWRTIASGGLVGTILRYFLIAIWGLLA